MICKVCNKSFALSKSLHLHLKAHALSVGDYYTKYYPRWDLWSGDPIIFKNPKHYLQASFNCVDHMHQWLQSGHKGAPQFLTKALLNKLQEKESHHFPASLYCKLAKLPAPKYYQQYFESIDNFCEAHDLVNPFSQELPSKFWDHEPTDIEILIDTREQKPLKFSKQRDQKLDFGDYTSQTHYSQTFIERKSSSDFASSFTHGFNRLSKEMHRCTNFNSYMFILVESTPDRLYQDLYHKVSESYLWHNVTKLMLEYPENLQICFSGNRAGSQYLIPRILYWGQRLWHVDLDCYLHEKMQAKYYDEDKENKF